MTDPFILVLLSSTKLISLKIADCCFVLLWNSWVLLIGAHCYCLFLVYDCLKFSLLCFLLLLIYDNTIWNLKLFLKEGDNLKHNVNF